MFPAVALSLSLFLSPVSAGTIAFFDNALFTDPPEESANLAASLTALGHTLNTFSGFTAADWITATTGVDLLVIPELDSDDLNGSLDAAARAAIASYVSGGGGLLMFDRSSFETPNLLNAVFGYSLVGGSISGDQTLNAIAAAGTVFAGGPATVPQSDATEPFDTASLPAGALSIYSQGTGTSVFVTDFGSGRIGFLGFDWFEVPTPTEWETVLGSAVTYVSANAEAVPEPATLLMLAGGLGLLALRKRRQSISQ